jgi:lysophospholipase
MKFTEIDRRARPSDASFSSWAAPDGWTLRRMDWPQKDAASARGSLLFVGGRGDFIEKYLEAHAHWHCRGWNVASFDWRGQGDSRGDIIGGHLDSFDPLVEDLDALVTAWVKDTPGPHVLVGHSMGGHLVLRTVAERRLKVDAVVLVAPMIGINASPIPPWLSSIVAHVFRSLGLGKRRAWKENERPALPGVSRKRFLTHSAERYEDELWWKRQQPGFDLGPPSWGWLVAAFRSIARVTPSLLGKIRTPILILGTDRDRLVSPNAIRRAAKIIPGAELLMFPGAAHELLRESDPVRLEALDRIDSFLDMHAKG